jgi:hypothetical protein
MYSLYADIFLMLGILFLMVLFSAASYYVISICCPETPNLVSRCKTLIVLTSDYNAVPFSVVSEDGRKRELRKRIGA